MKISELQIGDWVLSKSISVPCKVVGIDPMEGLGGEGYSFKLKGPNRILIFARAVSVEPIPLSPEILEKNGFVADEPEEKNSAYRLNEEEVIIVECFPNKNSGYRGIFAYGDTRIRITLNYLHQLQHALRLCGIEKEIEL